MSSYQQSLDNATKDLSSGDWINVVIGDGVSVHPGGAIQKFEYIVPGTLGPSYPFDAAIQCASDMRYKMKAKPDVFKKGNHCQAKIRKSSDGEVSVWNYRKDKDSDPEVECEEDLPAGEDLYNVSLGPAQI